MMRPPLSSKERAIIAQQLRRAEAHFPGLTAMLPLDDTQESRSLALAAASQCGEALPVLISFAREGEDHPGPFGHEEPVEKLADALKMTIECAALCGDTDSDRDELLCALVKFLEGWAG